MSATPSGPKRLALLGLGAAARHIHLPAVGLVPSLALVAGADPDERARLAFARAAPGLRLYADAAEALGRERPDWVLVAAPPFAHLELCRLALAHGAHVLCEKPFVERLADADLLLAEAERAGRVLAVNHEFPFMPIFAALRQEVGCQRFGRPLFLQAWEHLHEHEGEVASWRAASRTMQEFGSHVVDLAVSLLGDLPHRVFARMPRPQGGGDGDRIDVVTLEFPEGRVASIVLDRVCRGAHRYLELRLDGERASARASLGGRAGISLGFNPRSRRPELRLQLAAGGLAWIEQGERRRVIARNPRNAFALATARLLEAAVAAVDRGEPPPSPASAARAIVAVVEACYESARTGLPVAPAPPGGGGEQPVPGPRG